MKCAICLGPLPDRYWRMPVVQAPNFVDGFIDYEHQIGVALLMDVITICKSCAERQRGAWRTPEGELVVKLAKA